MTWSAENPWVVSDVSQGRNIPLFSRQGCFLSSPLTASLVFRDGVRERMAPAWSQSDRDARLMLRARVEACSQAAVWWLMLILRSPRRLRKPACIRSPPRRFPFRIGPRFAVTASYLNDTTSPMKSFFLSCRRYLVLL